MSASSSEDRVMISRRVRRRILHGGFDVSPVSLSVQQFCWRTVSVESNDLTVSLCAECHAIVVASADLKLLAFVEALHNCSQPPNHAKEGAGFNRRPPPCYSGIRVPWLFPAHAGFKLPCEVAAVQSAPARSRNGASSCVGGTRVVIAGSPRFRRRDCLYPQRVTARRAFCRGCTATRRLSLRTEMRVPAFVRA